MKTDSTTSEKTLKKYRQTCRQYIERERAKLKGVGAWQRDLKSLLQAHDELNRRVES